MPRPTASAPEESSPLRSSQGPSARAAPSQSHSVVARGSAALAWLRSSRRRPSWLNLSLCGLALWLGLIAAFGRDAGISYDESVQLKYGDLVLAWFETRGQDRGATEYRNLYLYGGLFDAPAQWLARHSPYDVYETRHLLSALAALLGIVACWRMAAALGGARAGFVAAFLLSLTPCWIGHGLFNPKDIPFGAAAAFTSWSAVRIALGPFPLRLRDAAWAGLCAGVALGVRPGGVFVLSYAALAAGARTLLELARRRRAGQPLGLAAASGRLLLMGAIVIALAWPIMLSAWPWAQLEPFRRPIEAIRIASHFDWGGEVLFEGRMISADRLPARYLPVWFWLSLPETYLLAGLAAALLALRALRRWRIDAAAERLLGAGSVAAAVVLPLAAVFVARPVLYDAQRHVLFLVPPFAALAGVALSEVLFAPWLARALRGVALALLLGLSGWIGADMVALHPYEYLYFNRMHGGLRKQYRRYETDYWGVSYREGLAWLVERLPAVPKGKRVRVSACDTFADERLEHYRQQWPGAAEKIRVVSGYERADVYFAIRRFGCHRVAGQNLHVVRRQEVPLLYVRKTPHSAAKL